MEYAVQVLFQIVVLLLLWAILSKLLFKPFLALVEEREKRTEGLKAAAAALTAEAERLRADYESAIRQASEEGAAAKETILDEARRTREQLLGQARAEAAERLTAVRQEIQKEMQQGRAQALQEAAGIARQMAEKVLGRKIG
ncbi:MAG TPA: ATP synthase F0 subunit B [Verrucomicrobiae bacterium]|jgi:F-type H+-transporting ATPase subunit b|nr:ATP synthase F0 subunit B [Verrucomicrobiae bacterium]